MHNYRNFLRVKLKSIKGLSPRNGSWSDDGVLMKTIMKKSPFLSQDMCLFNSLQCKETYTHILFDKKTSNHITQMSPNEHI